MGTLNNKNALYQYKALSDNLYQQVAIKDGVIKSNYAQEQISANQKGGYLKLSDNVIIKKKQLHDIQASNQGLLPQNTWISNNSSLTGDFKLPLNSILHNTKIMAKNQHAVLIDNCYLENNRLNIAPDTSVTIANSKLIDNIIETKPSFQEQVILINQSKLIKMKMQPINGSQMIVNSNLTNVNLKGTNDLCNTRINTNEVAVLNNNDISNSKINLQKAKLIMNDSDLKNNHLSDKNAIHDYLIIKQNNIRGTKTQIVHNKLPKTEQLDLNL